MSRQPPITYIPLPEHGLEYGPQMRAKALILRGKGRLIYQGIEILPHPHPDYCITHRAHGGVYSTGEDAGKCNCPSGSFGRDCSHSKALRYAGGVLAVKNAHIWWETHKKDNSKEGEQCGDLQNPHDHKRPDGRPSEG